MKILAKQALAGVAIMGGAIMLAGCYQSDSSIIPAADSIMPLKVGHYCEYSFDETQRGWGTECTDAELTSTAPNTYTFKTSVTTYAVHISGKPLDGGDLKGNYLVEACDTVDTTNGCYVGTIKVFDNQSFHWVYPACASPDDAECKLADEAAARSAFASATAWGTDDLRKYVWKSN